MATVNEIVEQLKELNEVYQRGIPLSSLQAMALAWADDLPDIPVSALAAAIARHRRSSEFWPVPANILRHIEEMRAEEFRRRESERGMMALPEFDTATEARCAYNMAKAQEMLDMLSRKTAVRQ